MNRNTRRYWREPRGLALWLLVLAAILWRLYAVTSVPRGPERLDEGVNQVRHVIDGDTLQLASGARVRLQGIDTPETVREFHSVEDWGPEASTFSKDFVHRAGDRVRLTFSLERKDRYDRFLAFVWNGDTMLNARGLAHARLDYRYSGTMKRRLANAQDEARKAGRGVWTTPVAANAK